MTYPRDYNAALDFIDRNVSQGRGEKPAFIDPERTLTYGALQAATNQMANLLAAHGIGREDRIAMIVLDTVDFPAIFFGAIKAGIVPVAVNTLLGTDQYRHILEQEIEDIPSAIHPAQTRLAIDTEKQARHVSCLKSDRPSRDGEKNQMTYPRDYNAAIWFVAACKPS